MIINEDFQSQTIWVIGATSSLIRAKYKPNYTQGQIINVALSKTHAYFAIKDQIGSFKITGTSEEITEDKITYEPAKDIAQVVCGNEYVAYRTTSGEVYARGNPFPSTFTKIKNKKDGDMPVVTTITGTPYFIFAIISQGRFCIISGNSVIYHKKRNSDRWYISCTMFLGTVLLLGNTGRAYTMSFNESNPTLTNTLQVFSEDPCVFTSLFSCHESLFFLTVDDYVVSYGYNHHGCLGVGHENTVNTLVRFHPPMNGESIREIAPSGNFTFFLTHNGNLYVSGQNPYDKTSTTQPVIFKPLEGKRITQILTCGAACIAVEGGHKDYNSTSTPPDKYKQFPVAIIPTCYTRIIGGPALVHPYPTNHSYFCYFPGDIVSKSETKGKVIGLNLMNMPIIAISHLKRLMVLDHENPSNENDFVDYLRKRPGHRMIKASLKSGHSIYLDATDSVMNEFGGFRLFDSVEVDGNKGVIAGARGDLLFMCPSNSSYVVGFPFHSYKLLGRAIKNEKEEFVMMESNLSGCEFRLDPNCNDNNVSEVDFTPQFRNEPSFESDFHQFQINEYECFIGHKIKDDPIGKFHPEDLYFLPELGLCYLIGCSDDKIYLYKRIDESQCYVKKSFLAPCVRNFYKKAENSDSKREISLNSSSNDLSASPLPSSNSLIVLSDMSAIENIETSYEETEKFGFLPYDRILTSKGYATVLGIHSGKIVAMTDEMFVSNSLADIFSPDDVELVAKVDSKPCLKKFKASKSKGEEIELLINVSAFVDQKFLVQDRVLVPIDDGNVCNGFIAGISNDQYKTIYVLIDNEDFVRPLHFSPHLIARYLHITSFEFALDQMDDKNKIVYNSFMFATGTIVKPGDAIYHQNNMIRGNLIGFISSGVMALRPYKYDENKIFCLSFEDITYHNIIFDIPPRKL